MKSTLNTEVRRWISLDCKLNLVDFSEIHNEIHSKFLSEIHNEICSEIRTKWNERPLGAEGNPLCLHIVYNVFSSWMFWPFGLQI